MSNKPSTPDRAEVERLYRLLKPGRSNPQTAGALCGKLGLPDTEANRRRIRLVAECAHKYKLLICSGNGGYWAYRDMGDDDEMWARNHKQYMTSIAREREWRSVRDGLAYKAVQVPIPLFVGSSQETGQILEMAR